MNMKMIWESKLADKEFNIDHIINNIMQESNTKIKKI